MPEKIQPNLAINESKVQICNHPPSINQYINFYIFGYKGYAHPKQGGSKVEKQSLKTHGILWVMHLASISKQNKGGGCTLPSTSQTWMYK